ncbi:MAG: phospho-sugar mutase [Candidatus Izimaplasma sp.]|nr:phospho-sugar mutase [Candidatus Izimaplasma bacterium]
MSNEIYARWKSNESLADDIKKELLEMTESEIEDAFYKTLSFGTGGMRGILGAGTNRMNIYTIRKANYGFGRYLKEQYDALDRGVVIAHDNRHKSREFAKESARVLTTFGIKCYLFDGLRPTPELSYAVRKLNAIGGIVVTASHNPSNYNGYKIYDEDGCQLVPKYADEVIKYVESVEDLFSIEVTDFDESLEQGMIEIIPEELDDDYLDQVAKVQLHQTLNKSIKVVFTPLHGASRDLGLRVLEENGFDCVPVEEQMVADPEFSTVKSPNPENKEAFEYALKYGEKTQADILIATDPDGDRLGIAVMHEDDYKLLTGNQTGAIFVKYILDTLKNRNELPNKGMVYNTIVTSDLGAAIARDYGMTVKSTLTGFKYIGEQAKLIEDTEFKFMFGYEESYGYVIKDFVRDKDSIQAMLLAAEITNVLKHQGKTLYDYLFEIYNEYGYYYESLEAIQQTGKAGEERIKKILKSFRDDKPSDILGNKIIKTEDYLTQTRMIDTETESIGLPKSNVLKFYLDNDAWFVLRPSGTEPKIKIYVGVLADSFENAKTYNQKLKNELLKLIDQIS